MKSAISNDVVLLTIEQAAERLQLGRSSVRQLISQGQLPVVRYGRAVRLRPADLERWAAEKAGTRAAA